jgi:hypothetical protein
MGWLAPGQTKKGVQQYNQARFTGHYGIDARTAREIFMSLQTTDIVEAKIYWMDPLKFFNVAVLINACWQSKLTLTLHILISFLSRCKPETN